MRLEYLEWRPHPGLAGRVECYWTVDSSGAVGGPRLHRVVPDGCMDVVCVDDATGGVRVTVVGTMTRAILVSRTTGAPVAGIRFRPGGGPGLLGVAADEFTDRQVPLEGALGAPGRWLALRLSRTPSVIERLRILEAFLLERLPASGDPEPADLIRAVGLATRAGGHIQVQTLAESVGVSGRTLERRFSRWVGVPPKTACRILRFRNAVDALLEGEPSGARVAHASGYFDQAHLIRDFRDFAGVTPSQFTRERSDVAFVQDDRLPEHDIGSTHEGRRAAGPF